MPTTKPASLPSRATRQPERHADDREDEAGGREREPLLDGLHLLVRRQPVLQLVGGLLLELRDGQLVDAAQQLELRRTRVFGSSLTISCFGNR